MNPTSKDEIDAVRRLLAAREFDTVELGFLLNRNTAAWPALSALDRPLLALAQRALATDGEHYHAYDLAPIPNEAKKALQGLRTLLVAINPRFIPLERYAQLLKRVYAFELHIIPEYKPYFRRGG